VLAIKSNNTLWAWGFNNVGQLGDSTIISRSSPVQIGNPSYTWNDIVAGLNFSVGLRGDNLLFTWGINTNGQLGDLNAGTSNRSSPMQIGTSSWVAVSAGGSHIIAIRSDKSLWAWGLNSLGQLGTNDFFTRSSPVQVSSSSWSIISAGNTHTTAITTDGKLYTWGDNTAGTLGYTTPAQSYYSWTSVAGNADYTVAIRNDGLLFAWGTNNFGQLGDNSTINRSSPVQIGTSSWSIVSVNAPTSGGGPVLAIRSDGTLWGWGYNATGALGINDVANRSSPVQVSGGGSWSAVASSKSHTLAIKSTDGLLYAWGFNTSGQLGTNDLVSRSSPVQVSATASASLLFYNSATIVDNSGNNTTLTATGTPTVGNSVIPFSNTYSVNFTSNSYHTVNIPALGTQFTIEFWVYVTTVPPGGWYWYIGSGSGPLLQFTGNSTSITALTKLNQGGGGSVTGSISLAANTWAHIAYTRNSSNVITIWFNGASVNTLSDATAFGATSAQIGFPAGGNGGAAAGYMSNFRLINNYAAYTTAFTRPSTASPASISVYGTFTPANRVTAISVGDTSSYVIKNDNKLYTWGSGALGASGLNDVVSRSSPTQIGSNSWTSVYAYGTSYVNAIDSNSKLFAWGANAGGQQGYGDSVQRSSPVQISNGNWSTLGAYSTLTNTLGIQTDGSLWAWGSKTNVLLGEFSNGSYTYSWSQVSAGPSHTAAVRSDGRLYTWGLNSVGQIGNGTTTNTSSPTLITTIPGVTSEFWNRVAVNGLRTVAVRNDGTLWTWGSNAGYLLGTGDSVTRSRPIQIANSISSDSTNANVFSTYFNGTTDYLTVPSNVAFQFGTGNLTIEGWFYFSDASVSSVRVMFSNYLVGFTTDCMFFGKHTNVSGRVSFWINNFSAAGPLMSDPTFPPNNIWVHYAVTRSVNTWAIWRDGVSVVSATYAGDPNSSRTIAVIGQADTGANTFFGYMSNFRIIKGTAQYTSTFTPSTAPLTAISGTSLLTCQNTTFIDNSTANSGVGFTITPVSDPYTGQNFTPFSGYITQRSWVSLSAGLSHTVAVSSLGRMYVWGDNTFNQIGDGTTVTLRSQPVQIGTSSWSQVSSYGNHNLAIDTNNKLYAWGDNTLGQVGVSSSPLQWTTVNSYYTTQMIRNDGIVYAMGLNNGGQIGDTSVVSRSSPVQISGGGSWSQIVSGYDGTNNGYSIGIKTDGTLFTWGFNSSGILGDITLATNAYRSSPVQVGTSSWISVSTLNNTAVAIRNDYTIWSWGKNDAGQLGQGDTASRSSPVQIGLSSWTQVGVGVSSAMAIRLDSTLWVWGLNSSGQLGDSTTLNKSSPVQIGVENSYIQIAGKSASKYAIRNDYTLWSWGYNVNGELGLTDAAYRSSSVQVNTGFIYDSISSGADHTIAKRRDGTIWGWGLNTAGQVGDGTVVSRSSPVQVGTSSWISVNAGYKNTFGITVSAINGLQNIYAWGYNVTGGFGLGDTAYRSSPVQVGSGQQLQFISSPTQIGTSSWTTISAGLSNSMAIRSDYKLFSWGDNVQLQSGYITPATTLGTASKTNNDAQSFIRSTDNALIIWGANDVGQLGDNTVVNRSSPVQLGLGLGYSQFKKIARAKVATAGYTLGVKTDGTLWSWGSGVGGVLGSAATTNRSSPVQIGTLTNWSDVAAGPSHALAIKTDGSLWGWGLNTSGQAGVLSWAKVSSGSSHTLALRSDGSLYGWGSNTAGQIGDISIITRSSPVQIGTGFSWNNVSAGINTSAAIRGDNRLFTWGLNTSGQLGLGDATTNRSSPTQVGTSFWTQVSARDYMMALTTAGRLYTWGSNVNGQLGDGTTTNKSSPGELFPPVNYKSLFINGQGSGSNITTASNANLALGATDHTVEFWVYQIDNSAGSGNFIDRPIASTGTTSQWGMDFGHGNYNPNNIQWWSVQLDNAQNYSAFGSLMSTTKPANWYNNWHHIAVTRKITTNSVYTMYLDGVQVSTYTHASVSDFSTDTTLQIDYRVYGYMRDIRITKSLVYTGNFSVPTSVLTVLPATVLLVNLGDTVPIDYSTNNIALTVNNVTVPYTYPATYPATFLTGRTDWSSNFTTGTASLATRTDSSLWAWGLNTSGQLGDGTVVSRSSPVQVGSTTSWSVVSTSNNAHTLAITADGKLYAWGNNFSSQLGLNDTVNRSSPVQVSAGTSYTNVYAGTNYSIALKNDNTIWAWGDNSKGNLGIYNPLSWATLGSSTGIHNDYTLWVWGDNSSGQLGISSTQYRSSPVQIGTTSWTRVFSNSFSTLATKSDNTLWAWGLNTNGQLGLSDNANRSSPVQVGSSTWTSISIGIAGHTLGILSTGALYAWGLNNAGQVGDGTTVDKNSPVLVGSTNSWTKVSAGGSFSMAIRLDGGLFTWGKNDAYQLGTGATAPRSTVTQLGVSSWTQVAAGDSHSMALRLDTGLFTWGLNTSGQGGGSNVTLRSSPVQVGTSSWTQITAGSLTSAAIRFDGSLQTWGKNDKGQLGSGVTTDRNSPVAVGTLSWTNVSAVKDSMSAIDITGRLFAWGSNPLGQLGLGDTANRSSPVQVGSNIQTLFSNPTQISSSILPNTNSVYFNGINDYLTLASNAAFAFGTGNFTIEFWMYSNTISTSQAIYDTRSPVDTANAGFDVYLSASKINFGTSGTNYIAGATTLISNTWYHIALSRSGTTTYQIFVNGLQDGTYSTSQNFTNNTPRIGNGVNGFFSGYISNLRVIKGQGLYSGTFTPSITALTNTTVGSTGAGAAASISGTVSLLTCQSNTFIDNSGNNFTIQIAGMPVIVGASYTQISAGESDTTFIATNGVLFNVGDNTTGQIGDSTVVTKSFLQVVANPSLYDNRSSPAQIGTGSWSQISAGLNYSVAIKSDGTLYTWGDNTVGYLGDGTTLTRRSMTQIGTSSYTSISSGGSHTVALTTDLTLYAWGLNNAGQLGDNSVISRSSPVQVNTGLVTSWNSVSAGASHTSAIDATNNLPYGWGLNSSGQIGDNTLVNKSAPVQVSVGTTSNYSYQFNGTNYLTIPVTSQFAFGTGDFTIECWVNTSNYNIDALGGEILVDNWINAGGSYQTGQWQFWLNSSGLLQFGYATSASAYSLIGTGTVSLNTWTHCAVTRSGNTVTVYINGVASGSASVTQNIGVNNSASIGRQASNSLWRYTGYISNVRVVKGTALYTTGFYPSTGALTINSQGATASQVSLLTAQSATIVDNSTNAFTITNTGTVAASGTNPFGPYYSASFNGTTQYLNITSNAAFTFGTGAFTIECWIYPTANTTSRQYSIVGNTINTVANFNWEIQYLNNGIRFTPFTNSGTYATLSGTAIVFPNQWYHVAVVRIGTALSLYINGTLNATLTNSANLNAQNDLQIGGETPGGGNAFAGYISNVRIVKGTGVYTGNFTPPTNILRTTQTAMTNITALTGTETSLLTLQNATIVDNSTNAFTITNNGSVAITTASAPFTTSTASGSPSTFDSIQAGVTSTMGTSNNTLFTWGAGTTGQLGDNTVTGKSAPTTTGVGSIWSVAEKLFSSPVQIGTAKSWSIVTAGAAHTYARATDFTLWSWGQNNVGQLGDSTTIGKSSPTQVAGNVTSYSQLTSGASNTFAINSINALLYGVGLNTAGQLGLNDVANRSGGVQIFAGTMAVPLIPIKLSTVSGSSYTQVQAGSAASVIDSTGRLFTWGTNTAGQVADNTLTNRSSPVQVGGLTGLTYIQSPVQVGSSSYSQVSAGYSHTLAIGTTGSLYAWGKTPANGATVTRSSPVQIGSNSWLFVSAGIDASQAIDSTRTLYAWGLNTNYQLGSASFALNQSVTSPVAIGTLAINNASHTNSVGSGNGGFIKNI
jgi:alpha-tubulin suppressor-like RCC1 family protein